LAIACVRLGDGQQLGDFSLTIVLYGKGSRPELEQLVGEFAGVFTNADGNLFVETYNQLNAYFATVPGNYALNLRRLYLLNTNYADLSFLFTILPGEKVERASRHRVPCRARNRQQHAVLPQPAQRRGCPHAHPRDDRLGKSYFCNFILQNAQKYAPLTFIFDIGGSFESLTTIFGGSYLNVGQEARDFTINPVLASPSKENLQFLFSFFRVLIEGNEQRYRLDFKEERKLWDAIERVYMLEPGQRTVSNFANIIGELKDRLHRWTRGGQYGFLFDNAEDTLSFSRFQTFNFAGWGDAPEVLEPLLFYVLHRASMRSAIRKKLATFKLFLLDEAWLFIKNETIRNYVVQAQKTWRKHNAAMILATQSIKELEESGMLQIVSESCPTKIFLANPEMNRDVYREAFHLNDTELDLIAGLVPPGQMLIRKAQSSKKVQLNVDSVSHWMATNNARDNLKKRDYFERFGIADGLRRLAEDFPIPASHAGRRRHSQPQRSCRMNRKLIFIAGLALALPSACRRCAGCVGAHRAVPLAGHRSDSREAEVHDADRSSADREDHGGRNRRQGFLDCGCGGQFLLCASGQGWHQFQPQPHHRQRQHLFVHACRTCRAHPPRRT
jgi:hypothetical protein